MISYIYTNIAAFYFFYIHLAYIVTSPLATHDIQHKERLFCLISLHRRKHLSLDQPDVFLVPTAPVIKIHKVLGLFQFPSSFSTIQNHQLPLITMSLHSIQKLYIVQTQPTAHKTCILYSFTWHTRHLIQILFCRMTHLISSSPSCILSSRLLYNSTQQNIQLKFFNCYSFIACS